MAIRILFSPPGAFIITLFVVAILAKLLGSCASGKRKDQTDAKKAYACGEDFDGHFIQPDYSQFFPFAFFFTILHVVALVVATIQISAGTVSIAVLYLVIALVGLSLLLRRLYELGR